MEKAYIGVSLGDPAGIGPEIFLQSFEKLKGQLRCKLKVFGNPGVYRRLGLKPSQEFLNLEWTGEEFHGEPGKESREGGELSFSYLESAVLAAKSGEISGLVTGPLSKKAVSMSRPGFLGHTPYLEQELGKERVVMSFYGRNFSLALFSHHIPLKAVPEFLLEEDLEEVARVALNGFYKLYSRKVKALLCGLNPHAGEGGLLGSEESRLSEVVLTLKNEGYDIQGPISADTLFTPVGLHDVDVVLACYHDQGLIPFKMAHFHEGVAVSFGLSIPRMSVDHGTAYSIAGKGLAHSGSMQECLLKMDDYICSGQSWI